MSASTGFAGAISPELEKASAAAATLETHLRNATNVNTGKLDLTSFAVGLERSNMSLNTFYQNLKGVGKTNADKMTMAGV